MIFPAHAKTFSIPTNFTFFWFLKKVETYFLNWKISYK